MGLPPRLALPNHQASRHAASIVGAVEDGSRFASLGRPRRVWAIGAIHAQPDRLDLIHHAIGQRFRPGDRLVYLGNMIGFGDRVVETVDRLLAFRIALLAMPGMIASDIVYLRGQQEEMWQKLLQLHFAPDPRTVLDWMLRQGVAPTLAAYGGNLDAGMAGARGGAVMLGRWTRELRQAVAARPGHEQLFNALRRAAYTGGPANDTAANGGAANGGAPDGASDGDGWTGNSRGGGSLLLVSSGIDPRRPLTGQGDAFWWGSAGFGRLEQPYGGFNRLVRGYDPGWTPESPGVDVGPVTVTLDGGCGRGGHLVCACFDSFGEMLDLFQA
ncbi:hypothetical protein HUE56_11445 [Azospirillum oryzae]|uniref:Uncharacterized protein n=1 Tax=Azospirillum oryzae TaxID=286727 RepID=A0A6N1AIK0_9PROT|nr:hypothetical protein [Azospirillum oryzae]KAA0589277.1 hypothetical protein FZ938_06460 [Azospirillum oryzae]QKS51119.1 hypothetical protein HUE56_11445 [Azospirillum oryzae]GLR79662.1 hypothetical protein GCM10007856_23370 [Azospirillum oryzae]